MGKKKQRVIELEKSQVALPPPGVQRFMWLGNRQPFDSFAFKRRQQYLDYYEMYVQHPVIRAAIDKKAAYATQAGWSFISADESRKPDQTKVDALNKFMRASSAKQLLKLSYRDLDIFGEAFWLVVRGSDDARTPIRAMRLNPRYMFPIVVDRMLVSWDYGPIQSANQAQPATHYQLDEIIHFSLGDPEDETAGLSPLASLKITVAQDLNAMRYNQKFFENSAQTGIIFIVKSSTGDEAKRNREWIEANYAGPENSHRPLLIEGDVDVKPSVSSMAEMEFLQGREFNRLEILMVLEMDPDRVGIHEHSNRSVSKEMANAFNTETIFPRQAIIEEEFNNSLLQQVFGIEDILFQHNESDPRRKQDLADTYDKNLHSGRQNLNEQRAEMGQGPIKGGEVYFIMSPTGITLVEDLPNMTADAIQKRTLATQAAKQPVAPPMGSNPLNKVGATPSTGPKPVQTAKQADAVKQNEPK